MKKPDLIKLHKMLDSTPPKASHFAMPKDVWEDLCRRQGMSEEEIKQAWDEMVKEKEMMDEESK